MITSLIENVCCPLLEITVYYFSENGMSCKYDPYYVCLYTSLELAFHQFELFDCVLLTKLYYTLSFAAILILLMIFFLFLWHFW